MSGAACRVQLFTQPVKGEVLIVIAIADITGQRQLATLARSAGARIPAAIVTDIDPYRTGRDRRIRSRGGRALAAAGIGLVIRLMTPPEPSGL